jgi:hypothetical protein
VSTILKTGAATAAPGGDIVLVRCTNPCCRVFQQVRVPADPSTELPCKRCGWRVGAYCDDELVEVDQPSPEYSQVTVTIAGVQWQIEYADHETGVFGLVRAAGRWSGHPFSRWYYDDPTVVDHLFTGPRTCTRCLRHHPPDCEAS